MSKRKNASPKAKRWGIILIIELILIAVLVPVIFIYAKFNSMQSASDINKKDIMINDIDDSTRTILSGYQNIALFGVDSRDGSLKEGARSDSIMLVSINHDEKKIKLLSIYRDLCVKVPDHGLTKACHAYAYGGAGLAMSTLNTNLDLTVTDFATVDFGILANIIDEIGGIELDITEPEFALINHLIDEQNKVTGSKSSHLKSAGTQHVDGTQAVAYSRIRKSDSDFKRAERQRIVISKVFAKLKSSDIATIISVANKVMPQVYTNLSKGDMLTLAKDVTSYDIADSQGFPFEVVTGTLSGDNFSYDFADGFNKNVTELHQYLFNNANYSPSSTVQTIGDEIYASRVQ